MPAIAGHVLPNANSGGNIRYLAEKREGKETLSLIFVHIGRLMPLEIVENSAVVYSLNTIPQCMMQAAENFTLGCSLYKTLRSQNATLVPRKLYVNANCMQH